MARRCAKRPGCWRGSGSSAQGSTLARAGGHGDRHLRGDGRGAHQQYGIGAPGWPARALVRRTPGQPDQNGAGGLKQVASPAAVYGEKGKNRQGEGVARAPVGDAASRRGRGLPRTALVGSRGGAAAHALGFLGTAEQGPAWRRRPPDAEKSDDARACRRRRIQGSVVARRRRRSRTAPEEDAGGGGMRGSAARR